MRTAARSALVCTALLGLVVLGYAAAWRATPAFDGDSAGYVEVATDLQDGSLEQLYARPLGYPAFLLLTGSAPTPGHALVVSQLVLHVVAVLLMALLLRRLQAGRVALAGFVFVALLPPFVEHAVFVLCESLTQLCVVAGLVGFASWLLGGGILWLIVAGVALGVVGLVHPADQLLWLVLAVLGLAFCAATRASARQWRRTAMGAAMVTGIAVPILAAMVAWNASHFGFAGISPMLGQTLSHKTVRVLERLPDEYAPVRDILIRHRDAALLDPVTGHLGLAYIFRAVPELEEKTGLHGPALSSYLVQMNLALIRRAPMEYVDEVLRSAVWYWAPGVTDLSGFGSGALKAGFNLLRALVLLAFAASVLLLAGPSVLVLGARARPGADDALRARLLVLFLFLGAIAYSMAVSTALTAAVYRLRIPFDLPILACVALAPATFSQLRAALSSGLVRAAPGGA